MAKKRGNDRDRAAANQPAGGSGTPPAELTPVQQDQRQDAIAAGGTDAAQRQVKQLADMRLDMMRSIVTEPLLSQVRQDPDGKFDVIIVLNEMFSGGMDRALELIKERAESLQVRYATLSHYCFACLTGQSDTRPGPRGARPDRSHGRGGSVIYRIWEDSDINITLNRSVITVKADAAQRAFQAPAAKASSGRCSTRGSTVTHIHFKTANSPLGPIDSLNCPKPIVHLDFTPDGRATPPPPAADGAPVSPRRRWSIDWVTAAMSPASSRAAGDRRWPKASVGGDRNA